MRRCEWSRWCTIERKPPKPARWNERVFACGPAAVPRLRNMARAVTTLMASTPLTHTLLASPGMDAAVAGATDHWTPDVVLAYCSGVAPVALAPPLARVPMVIDFVDVDSAKWATLAESAFPPKSWIFHREARCLASFEAVAAQAARMAIVVNERERDALLRVCPEARVEVIPNGVDIDAFRAWEAPAANHDVVFSGVFNYAPNAEGAVWLAREVWPRVKDAVGDARLMLVGANPDRTARKLASADRSIMVTGSVRRHAPVLVGIGGCRRASLHGAWGAEQGARSRGGVAAGRGDAGGVGWAAGGSVSGLPACRKRHGLCPHTDRTAVALARSAPAGGGRRTVSGSGLAATPGAADDVDRERRRPRHRRRARGYCPYLTISTAAKFQRLFTGAVTESLTVDPLWTTGPAKVCTQNASAVRVSSHSLNHDLPGGMVRAVALYESLPTANTSEFARVVVIVTRRRVSRSAVCCTVAPMPLAPLSRMTVND